ncbi:Eco57I restriction-modification methylase domain-containing protein [Enterococcus faecium]|uniref:Eco57I restriction-modification methylase domain-containing protein n=1 Tax=Enterococcus faecium TaxID=1352 RepID=UPI003F245325
MSYLVKENGKGQEDAKQFSSRLLGRLLFVWFLRKMKIINESIGYFDLENQNSTNYYNNKLKLLFFNTLNTIKEKRIHFDSITPYLNGGLFEPKENDYFEEVVEFPELFFYKLFKHFDEFNFTTDESNSDFELIAVDPEMLGQVFESLLASQLDEEGVNERNKKGSFYTPREIVDYMCKDVLKKYLYRKIDNEKYHTGIDYLIDLSDNQFLNRKSTGQPDLWGKNSKEIEKKVVRALDEFKVLDPACGSGAFPMGMLQLLLKTYERLENKFDPYKYKIKIINNNIFGVDIEPMAVEIARLRAWLSVIVDELNLENIQPLPNLDFKFVCANSLVNLSMGSDIIWVDHELDIKLNKLKKEYFNARTPNSKIAIQKKYLELTNQESFEEDERSQQLRTFEPFKNSSSASFFDYVYMFGVEEGFDAVIGNPPYISTKKIGIKNKKIYEKEFGFSDDTYSLFFFKGAQLLKPDGQLSYITPKSFWTTKSKLNLRKFLYEYKINYIFDTANPFNSAMVDTCITSFSNTKLLENKIYFIDGKNNFSNPIKYEIDKKIYIESLNSVIFPPNERNLLINFKYKEIVNKLHDAWWDKINTSKKIESNSGVLTDYRNNLKEGNVTLLGCVTEGGVGLQTGNNGKYVAVRKDTINAINIIKSRPKKLETVVKKYSPKIKNYEKYRTSKEFLDSLDEKQISYLFDELKEKYGRDIFGKGYLYRIIEEDELVKVSQLTREERENGIDDYKNHYVPYDKGDKDGNRWYLETPYAISWKKSNVGLLRKDPRARYQGYNYYFREGFCWSDIKTTYLKCRIKNKGINDVKSMSLYAMTEKVPEYYIVSLINSEFMSLYVDSFVNNTQTFQINDARQIPVIVPNQRQLKEIKILYDNAINLKKKYFNRELLKEDMIDKVTLIEKKINHLVYEIYGIEE